MKRHLSFFLLFSIILSVTGTIPVSADDNNPYELQNFSGLNLTDAWRSSISNDGESIVFQTNIHVDKDSDAIWVANTDGIDRQMIYYNSSIDDSFTGPKFSQDGEKIVFIQRGKPIGFFLFVLERNSTKWDENAILRTIYTTERSGLRQPSFSPDGNKIIYFSFEAGGNGDVWVIDIDGTNRTRLTFEEDGGGCPSYSSDGNIIVYERWSDRGERELWLMNSDGSDQKRILDDSWYPHHPVFMPDGKILFESARVSPHSDKIGAPSIWMIEQDGSNRTLLVPSVISSVGSMNPSINRNGTRILFEHGIGEGQDLYIVDDPDGDGEWEDSDGDHVADICDGYPFDPDRGYIKDDESFIRGFSFDLIAVSVCIAIPIVSWRKRSK